MLAREGVGVIFEFKVSFEAIGKEKGQERGDARDPQHEPAVTVPPALSTGPLNCFFNTASCLPPGLTGTHGEPGAREPAGALLNPGF